MARPGVIACIECGALVSNDLPSCYKCGEKFRRCEICHGRVKRSEAIITRNGETAYHRMCVTERFPFPKSARCPACQVHLVSVAPGGTPANVCDWPLGPCPSCGYRDPLEIINYCYYCRLPVAKWWPYQERVVYEGERAKVHDTCWLLHPDSRKKTEDREQAQIKSEERQELTKTFIRVFLVVSAVVLILMLRPWIVAKLADILTL